MKGADAPRDSVATDDGRYYVWKGEKFISVTNVLDKVVSKPVLVPWAAKIVAEYAAAHPTVDLTEWKRQPAIIKEESAQRGTDIHAWCEQFFLNPELALANIPPEYRKECIGFVKCIEYHGIVPWAAECTGYNRAHGYAGTVDLFGHGRDFGLSVLDIKTGKGIYAEYGLQLAGYRYSEFIGLPDGTELAVPETVGAYCLHVDGGRTRLIPMKAGPAQFEAFCHAVPLAEHMVQEFKSIVGKEIR